MTTPVEKVVLDSYLRKLHLGGFLANYEPFAAEAVENQESYTRYLLALAEQEVQEREARRRQRRLKEAKIPVVKTLDEFDFALLPHLNRQKILTLAQGDYIERAEPIILLGSPGLGKTHIASALALAATQQMRRVRFFNAAALANDLLLAQQNGLVTPFIRKLLNHQLVVIDELGFIPFTQTGAQLMFQLCSTLYERVAVIVTTNLNFSDWTQVFGDEMLTVALLDRLTHKAHIIEFVGDSYRFRQRRESESAAKTVG